MQPNIAAQANHANAVGNDMLQNDRNQAGDYKSQYDNFSNQATQANQAVKDYTGYMQGEGSAGNQYTNGSSGLNAQLGNLGYSQGQMTNARQGLNQAQGALSSYGDFANSAASKYGLNAGGFAAANAGALSGINNNIAAQQGVVNGLHDIYKTAQTGANQFAGQQVAGEHETLSGLNSAYSNVANQRDSAGSMMNFYNDLASKQGGLNAQQAQAYGQAQAAYASAQNSLAQASLAGSQTDLNHQQFTNVGEDRASLATKAQTTANQAAAVAYGKQNGLHANGQIDNGGNKIFTSSF